jgi:hypothetical protein
MKRLSISAASFSLGRGPKIRIVEKIICDTCDICRSPDKLSDLIVAAAA